MLSPGNPQEAMTPRPQCDVIWRTGKALGAVSKPIRRPGHSMPGRGGNRPLPQPRSKTFSCALFGRAEQSAWRHIRLRLLKPLNPDRGQAGAVRSPPAAPSARREDADIARSRRGRRICDRGRSGRCARRLFWAAQPAGQIRLPSPTLRENRRATPMTVRSSKAFVKGSGAGDDCRPSTDGWPYRLHQTC